VSQKARKMEILRFAQNDVRSSVGTFSTVPQFRFIPGKKPGFRTIATEHSCSGDQVRTNQTSGSASKPSSRRNRIKTGWRVVHILAGRRLFPADGARILSILSLTQRRRGPKTQRATKRRHCERSAAISPSTHLTGYTGLSRLDRTYVSVSCPSCLSFVVPGSRRGGSRRDAKTQRATKRRHCERSAAISKLVAACKPRLPRRPPDSSQ